MVPDHTISNLGRLIDVVEKVEGGFCESLIQWEMKKRNREFLMIKSSKGIESKQESASSVFQGSVPEVIPSELRIPILQLQDILLAEIQDFIQKARILRRYGAIFYGSGKR